MIWTFKRFRCSAFTRSKLCLSILSFIIGYLFHFYVPIGQTNYNEIFSKDFSSQMGKHNDVDVLLVVLIFSSINNFSKRQTLRETWLSNISGNLEVRHYFIISGGNAKDEEKKLLSIEQKEYNDLLIFHNLEDSFYLLTPKLVASFGWLTEIPVLGDEGKSEIPKTFKNFRFVMKCDDDSFVRITEIVYELNTVYAANKGENLYWGFFDGRAKFKKSGIYKEDQWNICDYYIPYALGGGYILAKPLVEFIARNEKYLKKYRNEDISVGAWLGTYSDINRVHDPRFDTEYISRGCHQSYLVTHKHSESAMRTFHNNLKVTNQLCQKEFKTRMSYIYNWQVVPSKCCARVNPNIP